MKKKNIKLLVTSPEENLTRKEALQKAGKYAAFTAAAMLMLSPKESQATSPAPPGPW